MIKASTIAITSYQKSSFNNSVFLTDMRIGFNNTTTSKQLTQGFKPGNHTLAIQIKENFWQNI